MSPTWYQKDLDNPFQSYKMDWLIIQQKTTAVSIEGCDKNQTDWHQHVPLFLFSTQYSWFDSRKTSVRERDFTFWELKCLDNLRIQLQKLQNY